MITSRRFALPAHDPTRPGRVDATSVAYLGWHRRGNLGDDAIFDAVRSQLPDVPFHDLPILPHEIARVLTSGARRSLRHGIVVAGGGTIVGRGPWRRSISWGRTLTRAAHGGYAIGVGVEDPVFQGRRSSSGRNELRHWKEILDNFDLVSVRGPRSAELLADIGVDVEVSGDPALILPRPDVTPEEGLIGLNLGFGDDMWGHDPASVAEAVSQAVQELASRQYRFVGILMNGSDERLTKAALRDVPAEIIMPADAMAAAREFARCSVLLATRLHAGILAALSDTPVISLEYQPKCRDFALSVNEAQWLIRTDEVTGPVVVDRVLAAFADSAAIRANKHAITEELRGRLSAEFKQLNGRLKRAN